VISPDRLFLYNVESTPAYNADPPPTKSFIVKSKLLIILIVAVPSADVAPVASI